jgi:dipeptidyl aminopeptidase/acylaminoacyl peptidase
MPLYSLRFAIVELFFSLAFCALSMTISMVSAVTAPLHAQQKRAMTFDDAMKFRTLEGITLSHDGRWLAFVERPDRGDPTARIQAIQGKQVYAVERGSKVQFSRDGRWAAVTVAPKFLVAEKAKPDAKPDNALCLVETATGKQTTFDNVSKAVFSEDGRWLAVHFTKNRKEPAAKDAAKDSSKAAPRDSTKKTEKPKVAASEKKPEAGTMLLLRRLSESNATASNAANTVNAVNEVLMPHVKEFAFDSLSTMLAVTTLDTATRGALTVRTLADGATMLVDSATSGVYTHPTWRTKSPSPATASPMMAFLKANVSTTNIVSPAALYTWDGGSRATKLLVANEAVPKSWMLPSKNTLAWSHPSSSSSPSSAANRLYFGFKPIEVHQAVSAKEPDAAADTADADVYNPAKILKTAEVDVWKWNDPYINPHQKKLWEQVKDRTYLVAYDFDAGKFTPLATREMPQVEPSELGQNALGRRDAPYRMEVTWDDNYFDAYIVGLASGDTTRFAEHLQYDLSLSPNGQYALYYRDKHWFLYDVAKKTTRKLTERISVGFWDDEDDHTAAKPSYGFAGWVVDGASDKAVILYDKFDLWQCATTTNDAVNLTNGEGRKADYTLRMERLNPEKKFFREGDYLVLSGYHNAKKISAFYTATVGKVGVKRLLDNEKRFVRPIKAQGASQLVFQQMDYAQFPDVWLTDSTFKEPKKITNLQTQVDAFGWGTSELVEWSSTDGKPLQGVLIKPTNYERGKKYPVIVYFYELFSDLVHVFQSPYVGSRPSFGLYASNGYVIFLPDVRYDVGLPGPSSVKCILPGVQKLIDMGIADANAIGIHGHSWSGYQTMYIITQTNLFKAAVAGAAVANMTSAYGGIRYGSGLLRTFQYEKSQSRIGPTLWERRDLYIENSPLFFADRITTPTLMMFGDDDDAVPWTQGIEMYAAMRRLGKDAIFLQYRKEPHHPRKYANRYDYAVKMKEYFDHYLKGLPAASWIRDGVPYTGK